MKNQQTSKLNSYKVHFNNNLLDSIALNKAIFSFFNLLSSNKKYFLVLRLSYSENKMVSLHKGIIISKDLLNTYISYILNILSTKSNDYTDLQVNYIIFDYFIIDEDKVKYFSNKWMELKPIVPIKLENFSNSTVSVLIPTNMNYETWGTIISKTSNMLVINSDIGLYKINLKNNLIELYKGSNLIISFKDIFINENLFIRKVGNISYYIKENTIVLTVKEHRTKFLTRLNNNRVIKPKIITIDIETILINGVHKPYLYSMYDGKSCYSFFTSDPKPLFDKLLSRKYRNYTVYAHNLSRFDIIFIFKYIASLKHLYTIEPIIKDGDTISIKIYNKDKGINITLMDSYLLLKDSLKNLTKTFDTLQKGIEPVFISDSNNEETKFYSQQSISHYNKDVLIINDFNKWKTAVIKYCEQDCVSLHQVIIKFRSLVYDNWKLNIERYPTTPSLAFAIYRKAYLKEDTVPLTIGKIYDFISESFTGGATEMYKPYGKNIRCYDVNSLYPFVMRDNLFPTGSIFEFTGDISILNSIEPNLCWIADCIVETKYDLYQPYLQIHHKINGQFRTVSPNGKFSMKITSAEYNNALKHYNIKIKNGYYFKGNQIFKDFVNDIYSLRQSYPKGSPMNLTCKLLMNSLFGRFAMKPIFTTQKFIDSKDFKSLTEKYTIEDYIDLDECGLFVSYIDTMDLINRKFKNSVGIASFVTSYARVFMSQFKNNSNINLYYTDTDSIFIDSDLPENIISNNIGHFKLEYIFKECVFLGPKIYAGKTIDNKYISKVKGYKNPKDIPFEDLLSLLNKDSKSLDLSHDKWFRSLSDASITIKPQVYSLISTQNKRLLVYNNKGIAIDTKPIKI